MPVAKTNSTKSSGRRKAVKARDFARDERDRKIKSGIDTLHLSRVAKAVSDFKRSQTYHEGANDERTAILAKVRRERKRSESSGLGMISGLRQLESWLLSRNERYKKNPGGL